MPEHVVALGTSWPDGYLGFLLSSRDLKVLVWYLTAIGRSICLRRYKAPCIACITHLAALIHTSSSQQYITTHRPLRPRPDPVPLGLARRVPSQLGQSSPQRVPRTWSRQPSRVGAPRCCLLSSMRVCSPPLGMSGRLLGSTECHHAPNQWTPRLTEHHTSSRLQQPHHLVMHTCSIWAAPPWVHLASPCVYPAAFVGSVISWQSGYRLYPVPRTVSLGRVHIGLSMLLNSS